ncbi:hypothetical protein DSM03_10498 [Leeuwenhoekiella aestuarii]|uniref:Uncharacterized protein n=1 Tax=Leeuwenhoekiella aestuarii TaxID=2249426 RepID=A0A4Q0NTX9_9FLAO|nr:DUF6624 domain-containing protein [Leeuwenhoekiella aestuarii]RXG13328.1 hypothetical protein DSM04_105307 [Leeuwenhoekiella aestuarii]RXG14941.1 hypothetical protein DSM03_10498 [Leeuwenhoekiella aestuarii]
MLKLTVVFLCFFGSYGQGAKDYDDLLIEANRLYNSENYLESGKKYAEAFKTNKEVKYRDRYNAACSWALAKKPDSSFTQLLNLASNYGYKDYERLLEDTDFSSLYEDQRWNKVLTLVKANKEAAAANYDKPLVALLDSIHESDQKVRKKLGSLGDKYGWQSKEVKTHWKTVDRVDSLNLIKVKQILDERGWLGSDILGDQGNMTLFLVIQHSNLEVQENYLPLLKKAVSEGNTPPHFLALLQDRIEIRNDRPQTYGSQVGRTETGESFVAPMIDPDHVDERRASIGLDSMESYLSNFDMKWDLEAYKLSLKSQDQID